MVRKQLKFNTLNDLTGSEWLFFTNSIWETNVPPDATHRLRKAHGAIKPPQARAGLVRFFSRKGERVLDPFAGVGGILLGAVLEERRALGIEVERRWVDVFEEIKAGFVLSGKEFVPRERAVNGERAIEAEMAHASCLAYMAQMAPQSVDAIITDPPYGVAHRATGFARETHFAMFSPEADDFANAGSFEEYLDLMRTFGTQAWRVLRAGRYLVLLIGDRYVKGEFMPLGVHVADALRDVGFALKGIKIWWNKATLRPFRPYAVGTAFVPNITHQNVIILRKAK